MKVLEVKNCIRYFESTLFHDRFLLSPATQVIIVATVGYLKELQEIKTKEAKSESSKDL